MAPLGAEVIKTNDDIENQKKRKIQRISPTYSE